MSGLTSKGRAVVESGLTVRQAHEIETGCSPDRRCDECKAIGRCPECGLANDPRYHTCPGRRLT